MRADYLSQHPFVDFVERLTLKTSVLTALKQLESQRVMNTNLILYTIWFAQNQYGRLLKQDFKKLLFAARPWHENVCLGLQRVRDIVNQFHSDELSRVVETELKLSNQIEQHLIAEALLKFPSRRRNPLQQLGDACYSITNYYGILQLQANVEDRKSVDILLQEAFPHLMTDEIEQTCRNSLDEPAAKTPFPQLRLEEL